MPVITHYSWIPRFNTTTFPMHYELAPLEKIMNDSAPSAAADGLREILLTENERIRLALLEVICSQEPEDIVRRNIRMHQQALLRLADQLREPQKTDPGQTVRQECLGHLFDTLESLLADYWDRELAMPWFQRVMIRKGILSRQAELIKKLNKSGADKRLVGLMLRYKMAFLADGNFFTYKQWYQIRELIRAVEKLPEQTTKGAVEGITDQLIDHLFQLQINDGSLFSFIQEKTREELRKIKVTGDRISFLEGTLAHAMNIVHLRHPRGAAEAARPVEAGSLLALYIEWLAKLIQIAQEELGPPPERDAKTFPTGEKIITSLSKPELALMVRLFLDTGVFQNKYRADVARFMTAMVSTRNERPGKKASVDNFYQLLFKASGPTCVAVNQILDNMKLQLADMQVVKPSPDDQE